MQKMLRRVVGENIELVHELAPELGVVIADPGQVEQVLMNLVINARDAMPGGGRLSIETANVEVAAEQAANACDPSEHPVGLPPAGSYVKLAVTDTGVGMDAATLSRLFEPFFTTKEVGKGTGLGLPTVYGIVKQSKGVIHVVSEPGRGSTFAVYLPREKNGTALIRRKPTEVVPAVGNETVLVVEDEEAVRKSAVRILRDAGYQVLAASNGLEALKVCNELHGEIHLVLTDVVMPEMDGAELATRLEQQYPDIRVLFMSGYSGDAIADHGVLDRDTHLISKPFNAADLTNKVRDLLDVAVAKALGGERRVS
jgi:CheY-like chemotaxis protein